MKTNNNSTVNVNTVANYAQAHTGARSMRNVTGTISQAAKALGGIGDELITIGKGDNKEKITIKVADFFASMDLSYGGGRVVFASIKKAYAAELVDKDGNFMLYKNVIQRVKIGKQNYVLYTLNDKGEYKAASIYQPAVVRSTGWTPTLICEGIAQSKFIDEVRTIGEKSQADFDALKAAGALYVHDSLTDEYVPYTGK